MTETKKFHPDVPSSEEFLKTMGQVTWLMTLSPEHRDRPIRSLEGQLMAPLMFRQVRVISRGNQPLAALTWAYVSPEVKTKLELGNHAMVLDEWRSGSEVAIVDVISPLIDRQIIINQFLSEVRELTQKQQNSQVPNE